jgi:putative ABC transport system ATP-binding protein
MTPPDEILRADRLCLSYQSQEVIREVSVVFPGPQTVAITGPSGSGKTSLLYCLSGLEKTRMGSVFLLGNELGALNPDELAELRLRNVGFVFQSSDLVAELTLRENIALPLQLARVRRREIRERVEELIDALGLAESANRKPSQVSGGQAQRCAVARAVVARPRVVFADEPTGALDQANRDVVLQMLMNQVRDIGGLLVTVTHDADVAAEFDRQIGLSDGRVISDFVRDERAFIL